jgi:hypothetical protein
VTDISPALLLTAFPAFHVHVPVTSPEVVIVPSTAPVPAEPELALPVAAVGDAAAAVVALPGRMLVFLPLVLSSPPHAAKSTAAAKRRHSPGPTNLLTRMPGI